MATLNLGVLAHVDAGKTSLTERLLHAAGVIDRPGSVDHGDTQTDTLALERQRGITIRSAVVSFVLGDVTVNLIDTPGHPDFIAEVERVLGVLDGAVLVVSAVEGVQPRTRILMRTLTRLGIPTLIFVNKVDRAGARSVELVGDLRARLAVDAVAMGRVEDVGTRQARCVPAGDDECKRWAEVLAEHDDALLVDYLDHPDRLTAPRLRMALRQCSRRGAVHPVFFGSAMTGAGIGDVVDAIPDLLPATHPRVDGPLSASVFKIERDAAGERTAYARVQAGTLRTRAHVHFGPPDAPGRHRAKLTRIAVFDRGTVVPAERVAAGRIAKLSGLADCQVGDIIGQPPASTARTGTDHPFDPPTLETVVEPAVPTERGRLYAALVQLAEQDPLIALRQDDVRQELSVSLYGEVQKEVIAATLADDYGLEVSFRETSTICIERPAGIGAAAETMGETNPFLATIGLRVEPAARDAGVSFGLDVELGSLPLAFVKATEDTVRATLRQGLYGWDVPDCTVTMTHSGYAPRQSHAHQGFDKSMSSTGWDFRGLTPLVLMAALRQAGTTVLEPIQRFHLELPTDLFGALLPVLARLRAVPHTPAIRGSVCTVDGDVPAAQVHALWQLLPSLTRGEGMLECAFDRYEPVRGEPPRRPRTDQNPLDRKEYLLHVVRRV